MKLFGVPLLLFLMIVLLEPLFPGTYEQVFLHLGYGLIAAIMLIVAYRNELKFILQNKLSR
jgi:hypothetical protein